MIYMNESMFSHFQQSFQPSTVLHLSLGELVEGGFLELDGCIFFSALKERYSANDQHSFPDRTGLECFVNSIHIDDYVTSSYFEQALLFVERVRVAWRAQFGRKAVTIILSATEDGATFKLHTTRRGEELLTSDLDDYPDRLLMLRS
jgi:hypothetical protein